MEKRVMGEKEGGQLKNLSVRVWEILRGVGNDSPLSVEDIRAILIEQDRAMGICEEAPQKDKYNLRLLRANIKAINSALDLPMPDYEVTKRRDPQRAQRLKSKTGGKRANDLDEASTPDKIAKCFIGRREDKECLYYNKDALTCEELRFLFDAVQSAAFLSADKADGICKKLTRLCGSVDEKVWHERVATKNGKPLNLCVFDSVRVIEQAIASKKRLHFNYCEGWWQYNDFLWDSENMDPIAVLYDGGKYYLYGYSYLKNGHCVLKVDRMRDVEIADEASVHTEERRDFLYGENGKDTLLASQMVMGEPVEVTFRIPGRLVPDMYDKFGSKLKIALDYPNNKRFIFKKTVNPSPELFSWCASYSGDLEILSPKSVRDDFAKFVIVTQRAFTKEERITAVNKINEERITADSKITDK